MSEDTRIERFATKGYTTSVKPMTDCLLGFSARTDDPDARQLIEEIYGLTLGMSRSLATHLIALEAHGRQAGIDVTAAIAACRSEMEDRLAEGRKKFL